MPNLMLGPKGFPRSRGDEPEGEVKVMASKKFSPLTRG